MPIKLVPPRKGRSKNFRIRGTYLRVRVDESTGTHRKPAADAYKRMRERQIEGGLAGPGAGKTFAEATDIYLSVCPAGEINRVERALDYFGARPLAEVTNDTIKEFATLHYPPGPAEQRSPRNATINREIISPVSAISKAGGMERRFKRYKEPAGRIRVDSPAAIEAFLNVLAEKTRSKKGKYKGQVRHPRAYALFMFSCNTRRTETMKLDWQNLNLEQRRAVFWDTKNGEPRIVHLHKRLVVALANLPHRKGRVFGYIRTERINGDWREAREKVIEDHPQLHDLTPHGARHDFATWRRQAGDDLKKIMEVGGWKDVKSVIRYSHVPSGEVIDAFEESPLNKTAKNEATRGKSVESGKGKKSSA